MATTLIKNAKVLLTDKLIQKNVFIKNGVIRSISNETPEADDIIDARNKLIMPGLINAHCHAGMNLFRGKMEDMSLPDWLNTAWRLESELTEEQLELAIQLALIQMIRSGTTTLNEHYFMAPLIQKIIKSSGMRAGLAWTIFDESIPHPHGAKFSDVKAMLNDIEPDEKIKHFIGAHSPYACNSSYLEKSAKLAQEFNTAVHLHLSESIQQVEASKKKYNETPIALVEKCGVFNTPQPCIAAHVLQPQAGELSILKKHRVSVVRCPQTYMKLAMPSSDLKPFYDKNINICLGSDGIVSNGDLSVLNAMKQATLLQKYIVTNPEVFPPEKVISMATENGAKALGFHTGKIEPGYAADLMLINTDKAHWQPQHNMLSNIIYATQNTDITDLMVSGKWLMRNSELSTIDEKSVLEKLHSLT